MMASSKWIRTGAALGAIAVGAGAFGAHGLRSVLSPERLETWSTAAHYHLVHSVLLVSLGVGAERLGVWGERAAASTFAGIVIFSGSLYLLCLTDKGWLGAITPLGGVALIVGWSMAALGASHRAE